MVTMTTKCNIHFMMAYKKTMDDGFIPLRTVMSIVLCDTIMIVGVAGSTINKQ